MKGTNINVRRYTNCVQYTFKTLSKENLSSKTRVRVFEHQIDIDRIMLSLDPYDGKVLRKYKDLYLVKQSMGFIPESINAIMYIIKQHTEAPNLEEQK